ncbi:hypothetical protein ABZ234_08240 [Nocardiopsis sp. NPDC006198]|uniref:hypothetical protein n=1 Tax=Nocardiopsis sp. NPDC006198 TaxID=3154472 RepID=UPI0033BEDEBB
MSEFADRQRADSISTEKELHRSLDGLPMRDDQWATVRVGPQLYINGSSPADVFEAAATWARANPEFTIRGVLWAEELGSLPQHGMHLLIDPLDPSHSR